MEKFKKYIIFSLTFFGSNVEKNNFVIFFDNGEFINILILMNYKINEKL